ncbi:TRIC cation channel family protein [Kineosporia rhizophila]|uniref:trimeric intracellular cation channel family protein n=1 Tax=Kineosporia rhizophila TaxID=84633 RepID=UPI001E2AEF7F|nr:TRIC cation channel family protein [Kineosporia rhizophila]MCE0538763.1 TRIC cation channel family protein [Kineosporia rhizophila]
MHAETLQNLRYCVELFGVMAFAFCGAFQAVRCDLGIFGVLLLSEAVALGGGLLRDLVLGVPPVAFHDLGFFIAPGCVALFVFWGHSSARDRKILEGKALDVCDAIAVAIATVTGCVKAMDHGSNVPAAVALGTMSAVGGGILANVLIAEVPPVLRWGHELLVTPAVLGASSAAILHATGHLAVGSAIGSMAAAFLLRVLALHRNWRTPRSLLWNEPAPPVTADHRRRRLHRLPVAR